MNNYLKWAAIIVLLLVIVGALLFFVFRTKGGFLSNSQTKSTSTTDKPSTAQDPLTIQAMRAKSYPGSDIQIEQTLAPGVNYNQYIASYKSDGLKIYGLLTVPQESSTMKKPKNGWPAIIFNHGYIPPNVYQTTERYVAYFDAFARDGYVVFKADYRGNGNSEGLPEGAYYSPAYATDVLNALATIKKLNSLTIGSGQIVNPNAIGMWGHSMGGNITLRCLIVDPKDIKAAVIWGGVVGSYDDIMIHWARSVPFQPPPSQLALRNRFRANLMKKYGTPSSNPTFWHSIDPTYFLSDILAPVQLHTGGSDEEVPVAFSQSLNIKLKDLGKTVEYYNYPGGDHNISSPNFELAMQRSIGFFDKYLKSN